MKLLNESGIRLPKETKSAKVLAHSDMDGFMSALLTVNQLERQGIPKNRIDVQWVQYGESDLLDKSLKKNRYQAVLSVDFSAFPIADLEYLYNTLSKSSGGIKEKFVTEYSKSFNKFKKEFLDTGKTPTAKDISDFIEREVGPQADIIKNRSKVDEQLTLMMKALKKYKPGDDIHKIKISELDYASDHHDDTKEDLTKGKSGSIGKTEYKSDTEHIASVSAQNLMNWEDVKEVSVVDSASYSDLENTISMSKNLKGKGRKERLAVIINAMVTTIIKSNKALATKLVKESAPSLISVYSNALRISKLNDDQLRVFSELKKENPNWELIEEISKKFTPSESKKMLRSGAEKDIKPVSSVEQMRSKDLESKEKNVSGERKDFSIHGNVLVQKAQSIKENPPRFLGNLVSKDGKRFPFIIKEYPFLIQIQGNASLPKEVKDTVDLGEISKRAVDEAERKLGSFSNKWAWDIIRKESGGHKTIWNISGLTTLGAASMSGAERAEAKYLKDYKSRATSIKYDKKAKKRLMANKEDRLQELESKKEEGTLRRDAIEFMKNFIIKELNEKYKDVVIPQSKEEYEMKEGILELSKNIVNEDWYTDRVNDGYDKIVKLVGRENVKNSNMIIKALVEKEKIYDKYTLFKYLYRYASIPENKAKEAIEKNKEFIEDAIKKEKNKDKDLKF